MHVRMSISKDSTETGQRCLSNAGIRDRNRMLTPTLVPHYWNTLIRTLLVALVPHAETTNEL